MNKKEISKILDDIYEKDQNNREKLVDLELDKNNFKIVEEIIENHIEFLLKEATEKNILTIWLVIQHGNYKDRKKYFNLLEKFVKKGKLKAGELALTIDRMLVEENKSQIYGSQVIKNDGEDFIVPKIYDISNLDKRRKEVGLEPWKDYMAKCPFEINFSKEQKEILEKK